MKKTLNNKVAFVSGVCGMDGSYLSDILISKGYVVIGLYNNYYDTNIKHLLDNKNFILVNVDIRDTGKISTLLKCFRPDKFFNLAGIASVTKSEENPIATFDINGFSVIRILEEIKDLDIETIFVHASSSEIFGDTDTIQREGSPKNPCTLYGNSKLISHNAVTLYRNNYSLKCFNCIFYNHTGRRRQNNFLDKKVCNWIRDNKEALSQNNKIFDKDYFIVSNKKYKKLALGNLSSKRDFSHAKDCMEAMYLVSDLGSEDYIVASSNLVSIEDFVKKCFNKNNLSYKKFIYKDSKFIRKFEPSGNRCDNTKILSLGWRPKFDLNDIINDLL